MEPLALGGVEYDSAGQGEGQVTKDGRKALELWVPVVEETSTERGTIFAKLEWIGCNEFADLGNACVQEENGGEVVGELFLGLKEVGLKEGEESSLVFLGAENVWDAGVFAFGEEDVGGTGQEGTVWTWEVRQRDGG